MTEQPFYRPILLMILAMSLIVSADAAAKVLTQIGVAPIFAAWARFVVGLILVYPFCRFPTQEWRHLLDWRVVLRGALVALAICSILTALKTEQMANAFGAFFVGPIVSFCLSTIVLREKVTWSRAGLLLVGFMGVLLVVKPGFGMSSGIGWALLAGALHGSFLTTTRALATLYSSKFLLVSQLLIGSIILAPFGAMDFPEVTFQFSYLIGISAIGSALGNLVLLWVNRTTPASVVAPLIYTQLIAALVLGFILFGDLPDGLALLGLFIILGAGISSFWLAGREK